MVSRDKLIEVIKSSGYLLSSAPSSTLANAILEDYDLTPKKGGDMIKVSMRSRYKHQRWGPSREISLDSSSGVHKLLVLSEEDVAHSIGPLTVTIEYKTGLQYEYQLVDPCPTCGK